MSTLIVINGSPRKNWNTDTLLKNVSEGAASQGASVKTYSLYDLKFSGCKSCLACKLKSDKNMHRCVLKDDVQQVLDDVHNADAVVLGSPIYFHEVTGTMRCFIERLLFPYLNYDNFDKPFSPEKKIGLIFTMNMPEGMMEGYGYTKKINEYKDMFTNFFRHCSVLCVNETRQVKDYNKYHLGCFDGDARQKRHETVFPTECKEAYALGVELVSK